MGVFPLKLFRSKSRQQVESTNFKEPIQSNRSIEWSSPKQPRSLSKMSPEFVAPSTLGNSRAQSQQLLHSEVAIMRAGPVRRASHVTDTTTRNIDPDARSIRVRSLDVFRSKPSLSYRQEREYPTTPEGTLPSLRSINHRSAYVDEIADELDTSQLRDVLDTDKRRRNRRKSSAGQLRITSGDGSSSTRRITAPPVPQLLRTSQTKPSPIFKQLENGTFEQLMTPEGTPVYDTFMEVKSVHNSPKGKQFVSPSLSNPITGEAGHWHDAESTMLVPRKRRSSAPIGVMLAGNRESFPDFAVVDSRQVSNGVLEGRQSNSALSSLWRRASAARFRKERDLAQHHMRTSSSDRNDLLPNNTKQDSVSKHMSGSSSVLYETLDDLPQMATIQVLDNVPSDAFYDPRTHSRAGSQRTHSRNFSRPSDIQTPQYPQQSSITYPAPSTATKENAKAFPPLSNSTGTFPKPAARQTAAQAAINQAKLSFPTANTPKFNRSVSSPATTKPVQSSAEPFTGTPGFSSPAAAAGINLSPPQVKAFPKTALVYPTSGTVATPPASASTVTTTSVDATADAKAITAPKTDGAWWSQKAVQDSDATPKAVQSSPQNLGDDKDYEKGIWQTGVGKPVTIVASPLLPSSGSFRSPQVVDRSDIAVGTTSRRGSLSSTTKKAIPPQLMSAPSYLTSTDSFYTATGTSQISANSSVSTLPAS